MRIYIAKVIFNNRIYINSIEHEGVFDSLERAVDFFKNTEITTFDADNYCERLKVNYQLEDAAHSFKVLSKELNATDDSTDIDYLYSHDGELLYSYNSMNSEEYSVEKSDFISTNEDIDAGKKFKIGDIILVKGETYGGAKQELDYIGVIGSQPFPKSEWVEGNGQWENNYLVYYITSEGFIEHDHPLEMYIELLNTEIPKGLEFLTTLSKIVKDEIKLSVEMVEELFYGTVYVRNLKYYKEYPEIYKRRWD